MANAVLKGCTKSRTVKTMDERLKQLVIEAQRHAPPTDTKSRSEISPSQWGGWRDKGVGREGERLNCMDESWDESWQQLVDEILRARKICRHSQSLSGVYQEIYQQLRQQLLRDLDQALDKYNPEQMSVREWAKSLRVKAFREVLDDTNLKNLALEAQWHPPLVEPQPYGLSGLRQYVLRQLEAQWHPPLVEPRQYCLTVSRQYALRELVEAIRLSGRLCRPHRTRIRDAGLYELIYEEAVNHTLDYVCQNIHYYDPERGTEKKFINWVNFRLDKMVLNSHIKFCQQVSKEVTTVKDLEEIPQPDSPIILSNLVRECLEEDAENLFKNEHIRKRPDANFQAIALATLSGKSWEEISAEFGIKIPTLSAFFQRCCKKFAPYFQDLL